MTINIEIKNPVYYYDAQRWEADLDFGGNFTGVSGTGKTKGAATSDAKQKINLAVDVVKRWGVK